MPSISFLFFFIFRNGHTRIFVAVGVFSPLSKVLYMYVCIGCYEIAIKCLKLNEEKHNRRRR